MLLAICRELLPVISPDIAAAAPVQSEYLAPPDGGRNALRDRRGCGYKDPDRLPLAVPQVFLFAGAAAERVARSREFFSRR
jgi:hypothetical protein